MKKYIVRIIILIICFVLAMAFPGCSVRFTPERYANPKCSFEKGQRKYERRMMKKERQYRNIDPLKWNK